MKRFAMTVISTMFLIVAMNRDGQALGPWEKELYTSTIRGGIGTGYWEYIASPDRPNPREKTTLCVPSGVLQKAPGHSTTMLWGDKLQLILHLEHFAIFWEQIRQLVCGNKACSEIQIGDIGRESAFVGDDGGNICHTSHKDGLRFDIRYQRKDGRRLPLNLKHTTGDRRRDLYSKEMTLAMLTYLTSSIPTRCAYVYDSYLVESLKNSINIEFLDGHKHHIHLGVRPTQSGGC